MGLRNLVMAAVVVGGSAAADPLADMAGNWRGAGWARQMAQGPQETVRCRIVNTYDDTTATLMVVGQCVVPGRRLSLSGTITADAGSDRITGRWSNPDGIGSAPIVGAQRDGIVAFNFNARDPATGHDVSQNVEWRMTAGALRLRSTDRSNPEFEMSDISFGPS